MNWPRLKWLRKTIRFCSVPIFLLTLAMASRTVFNRGTADLFHFGRGDRWVCDATANVFYVGGSLNVYEPGCSPYSFSTPGQFFVHLIGNNAMWIITGGDRYDAITTHGCSALGWNRYTKAGRLIQRTYWVQLPFLPLALLIASTAVIVHWASRVVKRRRALRQGLCPTCSYDLRAHAIGDKCPECGTAIRLPQSKEGP